MPTTTGTEGLQIPNSDGSDSPAVWPTIARNYGITRENQKYLATDAHVNADLPTAYPFGLSILPISSAGATSGGWPAAAGTVVTIVRKNNGVQAAQFYFNSTQGWIYVRVGTASNWQAWRPIAGAMLPTAMASGQITINGNSGVRQAVVMLPANRFTTIPRIAVWNNNTSRPDTQTGCSMDSASTTQFTAYVNRLDTLGASVGWSAIQGVE